MIGAATRSGAVAQMLLATLLWSSAGVITKRLDHAAAFEVTFWRSLFNVLGLLVILAVMRGPARLKRDLWRGGWPLVVSSACWAVMFTAFMVAMTLTTVANVLVTMALGPLLTALLAAYTLKHRLPMRTWAAILVAGIGIIWMVMEPDADAQTSTRWLGMAVALGVPICGAINWTLLQKLNQQKSRLDEGSEPPDMIPAIFWGGAISALVTLPLAWPFVASTRDVIWLAALGVFQLAIPCSLAIGVTKRLSAPEVSLLALTEIVLGVTWAWLGTSESPSANVVIGGTLVIGALALNEWLNLRESRVDCG